MFRQHFEWAARLNTWSYREAANHLAGSLTGVAEDCLGEVRQTKQLDDYNYLIQVLANWFEPEDQTDHYYTEFRARVQHSGKNATTLGYELKQMGPGAYPTFLPVEVEKAIIEQFVNGFLDDQMWCHLRL